MKLYDNVRAPNPRRVRIFLAEKGLDVPTVQVDMLKGEHKSDAIKRLNPLGAIPVLELDDGSAIAESVAICRYFEELHPEPALFGRGAKGRAQVEMWNRRAEIVVMGTIGDVALHTAPLFKDRLPQFPAFAEAQRAAVPAKWEWLDRELGDGRPFLAGDRFSIADVTGAVAAWLGEFFETERPSSLSNVQRWLDRVQSRPSWNAE